MLEKKPAWQGWDQGREKARAKGERDAGADAVGSGNHGQAE